MRQPTLTHDDRVSKRVSKQAECKNRRCDKGARGNQQPRLALDGCRRFANHASPRWSRRISRQSEVCDASLKQQRIGGKKRSLYDDRPPDTREYVPPHYLQMVQAGHTRRSDIQVFTDPQSRAAYDAEDRRNTEEAEADHGRVFVLRENCEDNEHDD